MEAWVRVESLKIAILSGVFVSLQVANVLLVFIKNHIYAIVELLETCHGR